MIMLVIHTGVMVSENVVIDRVEILKHGALFPLPNDPTPLSNLEPNLN